MIKSQYATQYTREHMAGSKNPSIDMTNKKARDKYLRKAAWEKKQVAKKK